MNPKKTASEEQAKLMRSQLAVCETDLQKDHDLRAVVAYLALQGYETGGFSTSSTSIYSRLFSDYFCLKAQRNLPPNSWSLHKGFASRVQFIKEAYRIYYELHNEDKEESKRTVMETETQGIEKLYAEKYWDRLTRGSKHHLKGINPDSLTCETYK